MEEQALLKAFSLIKEEFDKIESFNGDFNDLINKPIFIIDGLQTESSNESGGENIYTFTKSDGTTSTFVIRNGQKGERGDSFEIVKTYPSISAMDADFASSSVKEGQFVVIASNVEDEDNAKLFIKGSESFNFITDLSGAQGIKGEKGVSIEKVEQTTTSTTNGGTNVITVTLSDGTSSTFSVKNGIIEVDSSLNTTSENPVQNKIITTELDKKAPKDSPTFIGSVSLGRIGDVGANSFAMGTNAKASGSSAHAEGIDTEATQEAAHAEGRWTSAVSKAAHAEGFDSVAGGVDVQKGSSPIEQYDSGSAAHAEGIGSIAKGTASHAEGYKTQATMRTAHSEGYNTLASGNYSHAEGYGQGGTKVTASGEGAHAEGRSTTASGNATHAEGFLTTASNASAHAEGYSTTASGDSSHSEGSNTKAEGNKSHAEGDSAKAKGESSHAEGVSTIAMGIGSHAEGHYVCAGADSSHVEGSAYSSVFDHISDYSKDTLIDVKAKFLEVINSGSGFSLAHGEGSHVEGVNNLALGIAAHAEGSKNIAEGNRSHAEGEMAQAIGARAHAEGYGTEAIGSNSHAEGNGSVAEASNSHAEGTGTRTTASNQHVQGKFNDTENTSDKVHIVGWGTQSNPENIHTLDQQGNAWFKGNVSATTFNNHTIEANVPADAKFTDNDTWKANTKNSEGYVASGANQANKVWKTDAEGNPDWRDDENTTYTIATSDKLGLIKDGGDISINSTTGEVAVKDNSHNHTIENITNLQETLNSKLDVSLKGIYGGLATLDENGKVPTYQLPSYVSDVFEFTDIGRFPTTGESDTIYIAKDTNKTYRWSGTDYVEISASLALGETSSTAFPGDKGSVAYTHAVSQHLTGGSVENASLTPKGTVSSNFSGTASSHKHTFTGTKANLEATITSKGNVSSTFTGTPVTSGVPSKAATVASASHTHSFTPSGTVSQPTFSGSAGTTNAHTNSGTYVSTVAASDHTHTISSISGTISKPSFTGTAVSSGIPSATTDVNSITGVGTLPSLSAEVKNKCLEFTFSAGALPSYNTVTVASNGHTHSVTATGSVSQPTFSNGSASIGTPSKTTDVSAIAHTHSFTPSGTVSQPNFTGNAGTTSSIDGTATVAASEHTHTLTAQGSVSSTFTGEEVAVQIEYTPNGTISDTSITPQGSISSSFTGTEETHSHTFSGNYGMIPN